MTSSKIEWTDRSDWNPVRGCSRVSPGCGGPGDNGGCYAESMAARFSKPGMWGHGFAEMQGGKPRWTGKVELQEDRLLIPLPWRKPAKVFPNSTSDFFHEALPDSDIDKLFVVMAWCPHLTFQIPTKRAGRMRDYFAARQSGDPWAEAADYVADLAGLKDHPFVPEPKHLPLPNVWLGVSAERQQEADERIPHLLQTPAAIRFVSAEPLLGPIDLTRVRHQLEGQSFKIGSVLDGDDGFGLDARRNRLDWIIIGGESGPRPRANDLANVRALIRQGKSAGVAVFNKQLGANVVGPHSNGINQTTYRFKHSKGGDWSEWPEDLRVREFPQVRG